MKSFWLYLLLLVSVSCSAQDRFTKGEFKGFTRSPSEHIISRLDDPLTARTATGSIIFAPDEGPLGGALFEIRGPGKYTKIRSSLTSPSGTFSIRNVPDGKYLFKVTLDGYQSVTGELIISRTIPSQKAIQIALKPGV